MSARRKPGEYPNLRPEDIFAGGSLVLWRNPANKRFGEDDVWTISTTWDADGNIDEAYTRLMDEERALAANHTFAWNSDFGYLSPLPNHCGVALRVQGEFHLEGLHIIGDLPPVLNAIDAVRFQTSGLLQDGINQAAHLFHIISQATLGISEKDLLKRAKRLFRDLLTQESNARRALVEESPRMLEDAIARALAILRNVRLLSPGEFLDLLSPVRLAVSIGFLDGITREETLELMREQLNTPPLPPAYTREDDRKRDARDAQLANLANSRFASVKLSALALTYLR